VSGNTEFTDLLEQLFAAFNDGDLDKVMSMIDEDCVFDGAAGSEACGTRFEGASAIRAAFEGVYKTFPDVQWRDCKHFYADGRGVSEWTFTGTNAEGKKIESNGVDLFTFRDGKVASKNAFRKDRPLF